MDKILITGSSGFIGKNLYTHLNKHHFVVGLSLSSSKTTDYEIDITDKDKLIEYLNLQNPKIIIHTAYYPNVEGCEENPEYTSKINIQGTNNLIEWCHSHNARFIFISSDYVYSLNGDILNTEDSPTGALNVYTQHKLDNESRIKKLLMDYLILRTGFVYGYDPGGKNFLMQMIEAQQNLEVPEDQIINPTYVGLLCELIEKAIDINLKGIYNANGPESMSRIAFAKLIAAKLKLFKSPIPVLTKNIRYKARRPLSVRVDSSRLYTATNIHPKTNEQNLSEIAEKLQKHEQKQELLYRRDNCRGCGSKRLSKVISFGNVPIANSFQRQEADLRTFPLNISFCRDCALLQIQDVINKDVLFQDYRYASSVSKKVVYHFEELSKELINKTPLSEGDFVLEIGSNDGVLQRHFQSKGITCIGIEPASNIARIARESGLSTINDFFNLESAREFVRRYGYPKVVTASNVLAHIDDMTEVMLAVNEVMDSTAILVVEVHYLISLIEFLEYDNFYHEHLCEYSITSFSNMLNRFGLELFDVQKIPLHGGSIRLFAKKKGNPRPISPSVNQELDYERQKGYDLEQTYITFGQKIEQYKKDLMHKLDEYKSKGLRLAGYGASARGAILLNICGIDNSYLDYVVDNSPEKQGRFIPGVNIPIVPASRLREQIPDKILLLAYTYSQEIMDKERWYIEQGGEFIIPNPHE